MGMPPALSSVTPEVPPTGASAAGSGLPFVPPLGGTIAEDPRHLPLREGFFPRRATGGASWAATDQEDVIVTDDDEIEDPHGAPDRWGAQTQDRGAHVAPLRMADLDTVFLSFRASLLADVSRVVAASPAGSAQDTARRASPVDTRKSRSKGNSRRRWSPSVSSSSSSSTPATSTDDEADRRRKTPSSTLAVLECPEDRFAGVLDYRTYRLRKRRAVYGASQARKMGRTAKNMMFSFGGTPVFNGKESLKVFSWLRKFVKACDDNDVSEGMALYLIPNFLAGEAETRFTRNLPKSDGRAGRESLSSFPEAVNWFLSTYAEPHALGLAQDKFSRATLADNESVDAFAGRLRALAELCGNIHSEVTMKQQLIQGLPDYLRTDTFVYNSAQRSYQNMVTYVAGKYRSTKDFMAVSQRGTPGTSNRRGFSPVATRGNARSFLAMPPSDIEAEVVAALPPGSPGNRGGAASPYPRREGPTGPPLCYMFWNRGHRVLDCSLLTDKQKDLVRSARIRFLRRREPEGQAAVVQERVSIVALLWDDLLGGDEEAVAKGRRGAGNAYGG